MQLNTSTNISIQSSTRVNGFGATTAKQTADSEQSPQKADNNPQQKELSADEQRKLEQLKQRDREVRVHETAHKAAGGGLTGPIQYEFKTGTDGKRYAVGGEVSIDTSTESSPEATLQKAQRIKAAALAPADPSAKDRAVAGKAARMAVEARNEILKARQEQNSQPRNNGENEQASATISASATGNPEVAIKSYSSLASEQSPGDAIDIIA